MIFLDKRIDDYASHYTKTEPKLLVELAKETKQTMPCPQMLSGHIQGRFLKMLAELISAKNILEIGTFSGYYVGIHLLMENDASRQIN